MSVSPMTDYESSPLVEPVAYPYDSVVEPRRAGTLRPMVGPLSRPSVGENKVRNNSSHHAKWTSTGVQ
jgi:hypothetical protein